jgi:hypothetical protein
MNGKVLIGLLAAMLSICVVSVPTRAQQQGGGGGNGQNGGGGGGGGRGGRNFDPAQMRQRMMDNLKNQLGSTDDEFAAIEPKLTKVMDIEQDLRSGNRGGFGGYGGRRGGGGGGNNAPAPTTPVAIAVKALQDVIDNKDSKPEDIKPKMDALRDAKTKAHTDLTAAQKELSEVLTQRQEAVLVLAGILE